MNSSSSFHVPVNFLRTGLDDRRLALVGVATIVWNSLEIDAQRLLWTIAEWDERRGPIITASLGNVTLVQITRNLLKACFIHERTKEEIGATLDIFDFMRGRRNALVHGVPLYEPDGRLGGTLASVTSKEPTGFVTIKSINVTDTFLEGLISDLAKCSEFVADGKRKIENERIFYKDDSISSNRRLEEFVFGYRAPEIDKDLLKTHLATLHNRYSTKP